MSIYRVRDQLVECPISIEVWDINGKKPEAFMHDVDNVELTFGMWSEGYLSFDCVYDTSAQRIGDFSSGNTKIFIVWYDRYCQLMIPSSFEYFYDNTKGMRAQFTAFGAGTLLERLVMTPNGSGSLPENGGGWKNWRFFSQEESTNVNLASYCDLVIGDALRLVGLGGWLYSVNTTQISGMSGQVFYGYDPISVLMSKTFAFNLLQDGFPIFVQPTAVVPSNSGLHSQPNYFEYDCPRPGVEFEIRRPEERSDIYVDLSADNITSFSIKRSLPTSPTLALGRGNFKDDDAEEPEGWLYRSTKYNAYPANPFFRSSAYTDEKDVSEYVSHEDGLAWEIRDAANFPRKELQVDIKLADSSNISLDYRKSEGGSGFYVNSVDIGDKIPVIFPDGTTVKLVIVSATVTMNASSLSLSFKCANNYAAESLLGDGAQLLQLPR